MERIVVIENGQVVADDAKRNVLAKFQKPKHSLEKGKHETQE